MKRVKSIKEKMFGRSYDDFEYLYFLPAEQKGTGEKLLLP